MDIQNEILQSNLNQEIINNCTLEQLKIIYGDDISKIFNSLDDLKESSINYFTSEMNELSKEYNIFYSEIYNNIYKNAGKMIKYFKLEEIVNDNEDKEKLEMVLKLNQEKTSTIKNIIATHSKIIETTKENIKFLQKYLNICQNFDKNEIYAFYEKEFDNIARNWLLLKLNLQNLDINKIINESSLDQIFKDFIIRTCKCKTKNLTITIQNPKYYFGEDNKKFVLSPEEEKKRNDKKDNDIKIITDNQNDIIKLKMKNINEADGYFLKITSFTKLKGLLFENVTLKNNNILCLFPYLSKLRIKNCQSLEINIFKNMSTNLRKLYFTKNGFVNYEFRIIIQDYLLKSQSIRDNLEVLSFARNNIAKIDFKQIIKGNELFRALKEIDFRKNKLSLFLFNKASFPSLNFINLCENNFNKEYFNNNEYKNIIILESGSSYLMDKKYREDYYNRLNQTISNNNNLSISYLNISYLPGKFSKKYLTNLAISPSILLNLKKLTLSYNKLTCDILFIFISKIREPIYLKELNLNGNEINDTFFEIFLENNLSSIFPKLRNISLSSNQIGDSKTNVKYKDDIPVKEKNFIKEVYKLRMIYKFISINKNLKKLNITKNPISEIFTVVPEEKKDADINPKYISLDDNKNIIINCFFSFLIKIRNELIENEKDTGRDSFNIKFDCRSNINKNSENYPYSDKPIIFKK